MLLCSIFSLFLFVFFVEKARKSYFAAVLEVALLTLVLKILLFFLVCFLSLFSFCLPFQTSIFFFAFCPSAPFWRTLFLFLFLQSFFLLPFPLIISPCSLKHQTLPTSSFSNQPAFILAVVCFSHCFNVLCYCFLFYVGFVFGMISLVIFCFVSFVAFRL